VSLLIPCGQCGPRPVEEFRYGGEVERRPPFDDEDARIVDEAWMLTNTDGLATERWFHAAGCRRWVTIERDTGSDRIPQVRPGS
jgi:sarcosine oxidase, subunit delta